MEFDKADALAELAADGEKEAASRQSMRYTQAWLRAHGYGQHDINQLLGLTPAE